MNSYIVLIVIWTIINYNNVRVNWYGIHQYCLQLNFKRF